MSSMVSTAAWAASVTFAVCGAPRSRVQQLLLIVARVHNKRSSCGILT